MQTIIRKFALTGVLAAGLAAFALPAQAEELRIVYGQASDNALTDGTKKFAEAIETRTDGRYTGKVFLGSLLNFAETMTGVRDGITDAGFVIPAYHRAEFPANNLMVDMATIGTDPIALAGAASEYGFTCDACLAEYAAQNQVFLGYAVIAPYHLMSKEKVVDPEDMEGMTVRGFSSFGRWVEAMGGKATLISANDIYEALNQGQLDGNVHSLETLKDLSFGEVTDYLLNVPVGVYMGNALFNLNKDVWDGLSDADKRAFLLAAGDGIARSSVSMIEGHNAVLENPQDSGVELVEPSEKMKQATAAFQENDLATVAKLNEEKFGLENADAAVERFKALVVKWTALVEGIDRSDPEAVAELYNREVFSKVDLTTLN